MSPHNARQVMQNRHCSEISRLCSLSALAVPDILCVDVRNIPHILKLSTVSECMKSSVCKTYMSLSYARRHLFNAAAISSCMRV